MAVIEIDGVQFGVVKGPEFLALVNDSPGMPALQLVVNRLMSGGLGSAPIHAGEMVVSPQYATGVPAANEPFSELANGYMNWLRIARRPVDPEGAYICSTTFDQNDMLLPASTLKAIVERLSSWPATIAIDDARPKRPAPPPQVLEWERLRKHPQSKQLSMRRG